ncbi:putative GEM-like protein 8 [Magnolia sinica]|uniref:putative GEM-like protein 8 n=1 Tax=Magnolia sinica TaxID=86752 RepID=UPI00265AD286|nr:putative GEM-like protein 8 [Magnolia sinica]XP_058097820.1 putative GEM-like protein 8 [Magnolia sinica]
MMNPIQDHVIGIPMSSVTHAVEKSPERPNSVPEPASTFLVRPPSNGSFQFKQNKVESVIDWMNKFSKRADRFTKGVREHVRLAPKISETVKGKLSLGARILQVGGVEKVFRQIFSVGDGEKLLKACQCYLSTTAGPIAGLLFISTEKIAFCSERSLTFTSPNGRLVRTPYKVLIPLRKIDGANPSENMNRPTQKYIHIVTVDNFEFWFMGFVNYQKAFKHLQKAISQSSMYYPQ